MVWATSFQTCLIGFCDDGGGDYCLKSQSKISYRSYRSLIGSPQAPSFFFLLKLFSFPLCPVFKLLHLSHRTLRPFNHYQNTVGIISNRQTAKRETSQTFRELVVSFNLFKCNKKKQVIT